ncbi:GNAT family N-acetyltransferase [Bacillus salacetis]|uniref:GNAT family N-acetyltransferase n=1 Tax=Bacillus salacetis TaxID=2315464 RepID=A0A3A1QTI6_9BACI|nr:GNAT family N-acetyltransferase [Bacillus salacetis]RIW30729.1 GNAT family N-acetyltransferase [Bacillus salacetis]
MILELKHAEFGKCKNILSDNSLLETKAVIEGTHPGRIFTDDAASPASGFIWLGSNNGFIFIGDENNEKFNTGLYDYFKRAIEPEARKQGMSSFEAIGDHPAWDATFKIVFGENITGYNQRVYQLQKNHYRKQDEPVLEQGYDVVKITRETLNAPYDNQNFLHSKILEFWPSLEAFLNEGIGYIVIGGNEIASICFSGVVAGSVHGIDIETLEHHRGRKLGQAAAHAFVKDCLEQGLTPYWDCMEVNKPSVSIAENLGFTKKLEYRWYSVSFG